MNTIVMKAGGAILADEKMFRALVERVKEYQIRNSVVLTVSALGTTTRSLEACARAAHEGNKENVAQLLDELIAKHLTIAQQMNAANERLRSEFSAFRKKIEAMSFGVFVVKELSPRTLDGFLVFGERMATSLLGEVLRSCGMNASYVSAETFIETDEHFTRAHLDEVRSKKNIQKMFSRLLGGSHVLLTEGFIGATKAGTPTTMGYESSDYSATFIASALGAECVVIWKTVDGLLTTDPAFVAGAKTIPSLSYREAAELARCGAKVLHERAVGPAERTALPVYLQNVLTGKGTCVNKEITTNGGVISIASRRHLALLRAAPRGGSKPILWMRDFFSALGTDVELIALLEAEGNIISFVAPKSALERIQDVAESEVVNENVGVVSVITHEPVRCAHILSEMFAPDIIVLNTASSLSVSIVVPDERTNDIVELVHEKFIVGENEG